MRAEKNQTWSLVANPKPSLTCIWHFISTSVVTLHLRPLRSTDRAGVKRWDVPRRKPWTSIVFIWPQCQSAGERLYIVCARADGNSCCLHGRWHYGMKGLDWSIVNFNEIVKVFAGLNLINSYFPLPYLFASLLET